MSPKYGQALELTEHLGELRTRIVRSLVYVTVGMIGTWVYFNTFYMLLTKPIQPVLKKLGTEFLMTGITDPFVFRMQVCAIAGIAFAAPLITIEMWGFISPGLTAEEKRPIKWVAPLSVLLFIAGVATTYLILPRTLTYLAGFVPKGAKLMPSLTQSLVFIVKMYLACGLMFELPVVLLFLGKVGVVTSRGLFEFWRQAVVLIAILAAVLTPSGDFFTMSVVAAPVVVLYLLSIILVRFVEDRSGGLAEEESHVEEHKEEREEELAEAGDENR